MLRDVLGVPPATARVDSLLPLPRRAAGDADAAGGHVLVLDAPRSIAIALPLCGTTAVISGTGLRAPGGYGGFHVGRWVAGLRGGGAAADA